MPNQCNFISSSSINNRCDYITVTSNDSSIIGTRTFVNNVSYLIDVDAIKELRALNTMYHEVLKSKDVVSPEKLNTLIKTASEKLDMVFNKLRICPILSKEEMETYEPITDGDEYNE